MLTMVSDEWGRRLEMTPEAVSGALDEGASIVRTDDDAVRITRCRQRLVVADNREGEAATYYDTAEAREEAVADFLVRAALVESDRADASEGAGIRATG